MFSVIPPRLETAGICTRGNRRRAHGELRRSPRSGHDQHPLHDLRPRRARSVAIAPAGARADLSASRAGSSTTPAEIWAAQPARCIDGRARRRELERRRPRRGRHHQPARDDAWSGTATPASRSTTRSSGRTPATDQIVDELARRTAARTGFRAQGRACRSRPTSPARKVALDPRQRRRRARAAEAGDLLFGNIDTLAASGT